MNQQNYSQKEIRESLINDVKRGLIKKFHKQKRYRELIRLSNKYENRLMYLIYKKLNKSALIRQINMKKGRKTYMLTFMPINSVTKKLVARVLSSNQTPYSGSIELSKLNAPHLHLMVYPPDEETFEKIVKRFNKLDKKFAFHYQEHYHLLTIQRNAEIELEINNGFKKDIYDLSKMLANQYQLERNSDYTTKALISQIKELSKMRKEIVKLSTITYTKQELEELDKQDIEAQTSFNSYFQRKAHFIYLGFKQTFMSSRLPNTTALTIENQLIQNNKQLSNIDSMVSQQSDMKTFQITIKDISVYEMKQVTKIISFNKDKYYGNLIIENGRTFLRLNILVHTSNVEKNVLIKSLEYLGAYSKSFVKLTNMFQNRIKIINIILVPKFDKVISHKQKIRLVLKRWLQNDYRYTNTNIDSSDTDNTNTDSDPTTVKSKKSADARFITEQNTMTASIKELGFSRTFFISRNRYFDKHLDKPFPHIFQNGRKSDNAKDLDNNAKDLDLDKITIINRKKAFNLKLFAIFGNPVAHSKSPLIHNAVFTKHLPNYFFNTIKLENGEELKKKFKEQKLSGASVTVPHKEVAYKLCDEVRGVAQEIGAVNCIVEEEGKLIGYNTDVYGFLDSIRQFKKIRNVLVIGAGGTAKALVIGFLAKDWNVHLVNRSEKRLESFSKLPIKTFTWDTFQVSNYDLVVNVTSAGLNDSNFPIAKSTLSTIFSHSKYAVDVIYHKTPFLELAEEMGLQTQDGSLMLVYQGVLANEFFTKNQIKKSDITDTMLNAFKLNEVKKDTKKC